MIKGVMLQGCSAVTAVFLCWCALTSAAWTQDAAQQPAAAAQEAWSSRCTSQARAGTADCAIEQRVILRETGQLLAGITLRMPSDTRKPVMMVSIPLGVFLPAGLSYAVDDGEARTLELQTCDQQGCYAASTVPDDFLVAMKKGKELTLKFQNLQKETVSVPASLSGFTSALARIE